MPKRERELFGPWLIRQINSNQFAGVHWLDENRTMFRVPWKHLNMRNADERDYGIFKAWAISSGKYKQGFEDPPTWKTNFRCALNQVLYCDGKMFSEMKDNSSDQQDPHKIYRFNGVHPDPPAPNPNAAAFNEAPSNLEEQSYLGDLNEYDTLRISPDTVRVSPFTRPEESDVLEQLMRDILLDPRDDSIQQVINLSDDEYPQVVPHVDQVFQQSTHEHWAMGSVNGQEPSLHIPEFHEQCTPYQNQTCNIYQNGYQQDVAVEPIFHQMFAVSQFQHHEPQIAQHNWNHQGSAFNVVQNGFSGVDQCVNPSPLTQDPPLLNGPRQSFLQETQDTVNQPNAHDLAYPTANGCPQEALDQGINPASNYSYHATNEECASSSPVAHNLPIVNESGQASATETQVALLTQQKKIPPITSWEVTIFYRGKEVLKENVSTNFFILRDVDEVQMEHTNTIQFPSTDMLVNHQQISYTNQILSYVGKGLLLEVNTDDYKVYATRKGKSRVYWSMSENVEPQETNSEDNLLARDVPTEIFDFRQFWEELKEYKQHNRSSPDYTICMTFGQNLFEPIMRKFILVKLVPNFCTFCHQVAQIDGASSLHSEVVSLQISNGSFNSLDLNGLCLMDLDIEHLLF